MASLVGLVGSDFMTSSIVSVLFIIMMVMIRKNGCHHHHLFSWLSIIIIIIMIKCAWNHHSSLCMSFDYIQFRMSIQGAIHAACWKYCLILLVSCVIFSVVKHRIRRHCGLVIRKLEFWKPGERPNLKI